MIRRLIIGIVIFFCNPLCLDAQPPQLSVERQKRGLPENDKLTTNAKNFVDLLAKKDFASAVKTFDATMAKSLPQDKLAQVWEQILVQAGEFQNLVATRTEQVQQYDIVYVTCKFKKTDLDAKIVFDKSGKVSGLFFVPTQKAYSYEIPSYAKPDAYKETDIVIGSGKWALPGTLTLPRQKGPFPVLILVHGSGPQDRDETIGPNKPFRDLAYGLASGGVAVLRYEKRTKQYAAQLVEIKNDITVEQETVDDAIAAVIYLESVPEIDKSKIFILGHSLGGMLIPMIAQKSSRIAGYIIMAGTSRPLEKVVYEQYKYILSLDGTMSDDDNKILNELESQIKMVQSAELTKDIPSEKLPLGAPASYWLSLKGYEPAKLAAKITKPILILQGERDYQVTMDDYKGWQNALSKNPNVTFKLYKDLNHLFIEGKGKSTPSEYEKSGHVSQKVISDIIDWISRLS